MKFSRQANISCIAKKVCLKVWCVFFPPLRKMNMVIAFRTKCFLNVGEVRWGKGETHGITTHTNQLVKMKKRNQIIIGKYSQKT